jgi:hypothetical protein
VVCAPAVVEAVQPRAGGPDLEAQRPRELLEVGVRRRDVQLARLDVRQPRSDEQVVQLLRETRERAGRAVGRWRIRFVKLLQVALETASTTEVR